MNWTDVYNSVKSLVKSMLIALFLLCIVELVFRVFVLNDDFNVRISDENLAKIYGAENIADYRNVIEEQGKRWIYKPYVEYKESPRLGKFVSVSSNNIRCNSNGDSSCDIKSGKKVIWLFGGSTMFGYGVKNSETISAHLEEMMPTYEVINLGQGAYYSTSENILFNSYLSQGLFPEIAIFLDGLNDYYFYQVPDRSVASDSIEDRLSNNINTLSDPNEFILAIKKIAVNFNSIVWANNKLRQLKLPKDDKDFILDDKALSKVRKRIEYNFLSRVAISKILDIKLLNVLQPIPSYGTGHDNSNVPTEMIFLGKHANSGRGYLLLDKSKLGTEGINFMDLSNFDIKDSMYVDTVHYSSKMNKAIAHEIHDFLEKTNKYQKQ